MTSMLYQLTASAAQMCAPVPATAPGGFVDWLDHWQTLLGAAIGGALGVAGALVVAGSTRRREQRIAAGMVLPDLHQLAAAGEHLETLLPEPQRSDTDPRPFVGHRELENLKADRITKAIDRLAGRRPALFALHTPVIGQLTDVDARLYSHLFQCEMIHRQFEEGIGVYESAAQYLTSTVKPKTSPSRPAPPAALLHADWKRAVEHATLAAYFLDRLVFSCWPRWVQRCRMNLRPNDLDRRSAHLIETGQLPAEQASAAPAQQNEPV